MTLDITTDQMIYLLECVDDRIAAVRHGVEPHPPAAKSIILKDLTALRAHLKDAYEQQRGVQPIIAAV